METNRLALGCLLGDVSLEKNSTALERASDRRNLRQ